MHIFNKYFYIKKRFNLMLIESFSQNYVFNC